MIRFLLLALFLPVASAIAQNRVLVSEVTSIYDGDTFRANIEGWPPIIGERMPIRIKGIDTPELRGKCRQEAEGARLAKQATVTALRARPGKSSYVISRGASIFVCARQPGSTAATWVKNS